MAQDCMLTIKSMAIAIYEVVDSPTAEVDEAFGLWSIVPNNPDHAPAKPSFKSDMVPCTCTPTMCMSTTFTNLCDGAH